MVAIQHSSESTKWRETEMMVSSLAISVLAGVAMGYAVDAWRKQHWVVIEKPDAIVWNGTALGMRPGDELGSWPSLGPEYVVVLARHQGDQSDVRPLVRIHSDELLSQLQAAALAPLNQLNLVNRGGQSMVLSCSIALTERTGSQDDTVQFFLELSPPDRFPDSMSYLGPARYRPESLGFASDALQALGFDVSVSALTELCSVNSAHRSQP